MLSAKRETKPRCESGAPEGSSHRAGRWVPYHASVSSITWLKGFGHYEVYGGDVFRQVMEETLAWYGTHLPAR